jgi:23S rRNA U2552 (ribose-2'-O)-methylase RlmE/FtsJ
MSKKDESDIIPKINDFDYIPLVVDVSTKEDKDFYNLDPSIKLSTNIDYPIFTNGFHHYIHASKNKMEIIKQFEDKKKVYLIMNKFERYVDNYDEDINNTTNKFFDLKKSPEILSRGFYKLWEILNMFELFDNKKALTSAHLSEGPGSFVQCLLLFREKYSDKSKSDKYNIIPLNSDDESNHIPELDKEFVKYYSSKLNILKTYPKQVAGGYNDKHDGDLTNPKTINLIGGQISEKVDFVTADGGINWKNDNTQEQEAFRLIFSQVLSCFKLIKKGGSFVCKFYETYTESNMKVIYLLSQMFDKVTMVKPLMSRPYLGEKYAVCQNFKFSDSDAKFKSLTKKLDDVHKSLHESKTLNIVEIYPDLVLPNDYRIDMIHVNKLIANKQIKMINEIIEFINAQNYYGDVYQDHRQLQIEANKYWIRLFFPDKKDHDKISEHLINSTNKIIEKTKQVLTTVKYI